MPSNWGPSHTNDIVIAYNDDAKKILDSLIVAPWGSTIKMKDIYGYMVDVAKAKVNSKVGLVFTSGSKCLTLKKEDLVSFCISHSIEIAKDLTCFLNNEAGEERLKEINGIGNKTCDYMKRLLGFDTVAVDRHIREFLIDADIVYDDYIEIKEVVEFAADFMDVARRKLDYSIWSYMSHKRNNIGELLLEFDF